MEAAIKRLKELSEDYTETADKFENRDFTLTSEDRQVDPERVKRLVETYRFWAHCLGTSAWLLESDLKK